MKEKTCCFTGHRKIAPCDLPELKQRLEEEILWLIRQGIVYFGAGGALGFDTIAEETVLSLRQSAPQIKLILVLPYRAQASHWGREEQERYQSILAHADKIIYISEGFTPGCYFKRNRHLAENSVYCICYVRKKCGGSWYTKNYAVQHGVSIIEL